MADNIVTADAVAAARAEALAQLAECYNVEGEGGHAVADDVLVKFLKAVGHADIADLFDRLDKWYA
jgi:hypothetical protein